MEQVMGNVILVLGMGYLLVLGWQLQCGLNYRRKSLEARGEAGVEAVSPEGAEA